MSTIEKLSIQGIRSFGTNAEDAQNIAFGSPVTLILGENGCGKTTIIECLKYALTGETPPGSDRGKNFVHDPKIFSLADTLGQIKLQVRNIRGERLSVCRSMKIANRRGKYSFETLDSTMNYLDSGGAGASADSISKRCADVDGAMTEFMGVSKAIINNVLFCHQEDSSWPLDEAKKLKEKFDAIFGISEYNKAIEKFIKMRKEEMTDLKIKEANLNFHAHLKEEMDNKSLSLKKAEDKCVSVREQCDRFDEEMKPIDERLAEIRNIEYEVAKYQNLKVELETKQKNCREQIVKIEKNIKKLYDGSIDELDLEIQSFDEKMSEKKRERVEQERKLNSLKAQESALQKKYNELDRKRGGFLQQRQKEQECIAERSNKIKTLSGHLNLPLSMDLEQATLDEVLECLKAIDNALIGEQCQIAETTAQHDGEDQQRQTEIDTLRVDKTKMEEGVLVLRKQKAGHEKESTAISRKIGEIEISAHRLKKVTTEIERITTFYETKVAEFNPDEMRETINAGKTKVTELQENFKKIDARLTVLNSISKVLTEIKLKQQELDKREQEVRRVRSKHGDNLQAVLAGATVEANYKRTVQTAYEKLRREIAELNERQSALKLNENSLEIERKNLKKQLEKMEKELEEAKERIFEKCHATPYEDVIEKSKATVSKYQLDHGAMRSAEAMYKKYMHKIEENPCCPLCHKGMSGNEAADLTTELSDEIHQLPDNIKRTEKLLKVEQKKYEGLLQLKPAIDKVTRLEDEIPKRKDELKTVQEKLAECATETESLQLLLAEPTINLDLANNMMGDMSLLDEALKDEARFRKDVDKLKAKLPAEYESNVSIDDLQLEKVTIAAELENERRQVEKMQNDFEKTTEALNKLREKKNVLKEEQVKLQEGVQSLPQLKERQSELAQLMESSDVEIQEGLNKVQPLKQQLNAAIDAKVRLKEANRKKVAQMQAKYDQHSKIDHDIQRLNKEVLEYQKLSLEIEIERLKEQLQSKKDELTEKTNEITKAADELDVVKTECLTQVTLERDLKDNRELKMLQQKQITLNEEFEVLAKQQVDADFRKVTREKNELIKKRDAATVRKGELLGQIGEINNQIKQLQKEIGEPKYKESLQNYRRANYEVEVGRRVIQDLGTYRVALEWALMQFHSEKMDNINRLIREYWRLIYSGNDIDYIQIQTDEANTDSSASADRRRNYNYRVVQSKNNTELEMRGRCSAGQRVLASLIIRMALAETFSTNCGVLALDEPTTNLDRMNIMSLCDALNRIVEERQTQSNFMLIIITHDEDFISKLGKINSYHRVFRNDECKSVIRKVKVS